MNSLYEQVMTVLYAIWRRRWYGIAAMWGICIVGWAIVAAIPNSYSASARIYVDTNTILSRVLDAPGTGVRREIDIMRRTLISRPNLEKVVRRSDLDLTVETDSEMNSLIEGLRKNISIRSQGADLFEVSYSSANPRFTNQENAELSKRVVQNILSIFVEVNLKGGREKIIEALRFINEQIDDLERQLEGAERRRAEFEQENLGYLPGEQNFMRQMQSAQQDLNKIEEDIEDHNVVLGELERQLSTISPYVSANGQQGGAVGPLGQRIQGMQEHIDNMRIRGYKDQHPDVLTAKRQMEALMEEQAKMLESDDGKSLAPGATNPVYNEVSRRIVQIRTDLARFNSRKAKTEASIQSLSEKARSVPEIEAQMAQLNRDYGIIKKKYQGLLDQRERFKTAQDIETRTDKVQFRIIEPPKVPLAPSAPNRPMLLTTVLVAAIGVGVALSFLLSQLHTTYASVQRLRDSLAVPVLGAVSALVSEQQKRQRLIEMSFFGLLFFAVFLAFALVMVLELSKGTTAV
ncbi:MAG: XrtA system polysaccharide chain length determinant [Pseudomonadota bacterium]